MAPNDDTTRASAGLLAIHRKQVELIAALEPNDDVDSLLGTIALRWSELPERHWQAARTVLDLASDGDVEEFAPVVTALFDLIDAIATVDYDEHHPDGGGARFRQFSPIINKAHTVAQAIEAWEGSLVGVGGGA